MLPKKSAAFQVTAITAITEIAYMLMSNIRPHFSLPVEHPMRIPQASLCFQLGELTMKCQPWSEVVIENSSRDMVFSSGCSLVLLQIL